MIKQCKQCGCSFETVKKNIVFCSDDCRARAHKRIKKAVERSKSPFTEEQEERINYINQEGKKAERLLMKKAYHVKRNGAQKDAIRALIDKGDLEAVLALYSPLERDYWGTVKAIEKKKMQEKGHNAAIRTVNGIKVTEPTFATKVLESIQRGEKMQFGWELEEQPTHHKTK